MSSEGWERYRLNDLVDEKRGISYGIVQPGSFLESGGVPILKVNNLTEKRTTIQDVFRVSEDIEKKFQRTRLQGNEILVSLVGSVGYIFKTTEEQKGWNVVRAIGVLPIRENINRDWVYWWLKSPEAQEAFRNLATVTVQATLNLKELKEIEIPFPDEETQTRIAAILSALDDKIELNRQTNATLEAIAQAIFKEWFVDFRFPRATGEMQDSELGPIPKGWRVGKLEDIYRTTSGGTPSRSHQEYYENGNINWVKSKELTGSFVTETEERITEQAVKKSSAKTLPTHSVLIAMYGATVGECGIISMESTCNQAICAFIPSEQYPYTFIYQFLKLNKEEIISRAVGSAQQNISQQTLKNINLVLPPVDLIRRYHKVVSHLFEIIETNIMQSAEIAKIRDILIPKLMSGEIEV